MKKFVLLSMLILIGCSGSPDPKDTVFAFLDAVMTSDSLGIENSLDIDAYVKMKMTEMSSEDSAKVLAENRDKTIRSLLGNGIIRQRWLNQQILVNEATQTDSSAEVEVSFIDPTTRHQVYGKFRLEKQPDKTWKISYFF